MAKKIKIRVKKPKHSDAAVHFNTALQYYHSGNLSRAEMVCKQILNQHPDHADVWHLLGLITRKGGQEETAIHYFSEAIHVNPKAASYYFDIGLSFWAKDYSDEAMESFLRALALKPDYAEAHFQVGFILQQQNRLEEAARSYEQAILFQRDNAEAYNNLGVIFLEQNNIEAALQVFDHAVSLEPDYAEAYNSLGLVMLLKGAVDDALDNFRKSLALKPDFAKAHENSGIGYLLAKDFERGWEEYEWRLQTIKVIPLLKPSWHGEPLENKAILVYWEQGYGDTLQFARYLPKLYEDFGARKVLFIPQEGLVQLLRESDLKAEILDAGTSVETLEYDTNIHLLSLPRIFKTNLENMPFKGKRYLKANPEKVEWYREKFFDPTPYTLHPAPFRIGIFWQGSQLFKYKKYKSLSLSNFYPIVRMPQVKIYSLQKGDGIEQLYDLPEGIDIVNLGETFNDFSDTAAAIENLDLVISVDTAVAHLSGALGKKTWILLPSYAEWRWHLDMDYSPWYEDVRLFRHKEQGKKDWEEMMERVVEELLKNRAEGVAYRG